jgi:hypothetical protein
MSYCRTLFLAVAAAAACTTTSIAVGATIAKVNKEKNKVIIVLSQAEMAKISEGDEVVVEFGKDAFITHGVLTKLNPVKQSVVLTVEIPDDRFAEKQTIRFLSTYWNAPYGGVLRGYSQYHQYSRSSLDAGFGGIGGQVTADLDGDKTTDKFGGTTFRADGYLMFDREWLGLGFGYERFDLTMTDLDATSNIVRPGLWFGVESGWRIGIRYDYTALQHDVDGGSTFIYELGSPVVDVTHFSATSEFGLQYKDRAAFTAIDTSTTPDGTSVDVESPLRVPAEVSVYSRWVSSPLYVWGLGLGYLFFERELDDSLPLRERPKIHELLRMQFTFEHRLSDGDKFDWQLYYDGGKTPAPHGNEKVINSLGWRGAYQMPFGSGHMAGVSTYVEGGVHSRTVSGPADPTTGESEDLTLKYSGFGYGLLMFVHYELDLAGKPTRRGS